MGNSCLPKINTRQEMLWQHCPLSSDMLQKTENEPDPHEVYSTCSVVPHVLIPTHSPHWWDLIEQITILLIHCFLQCLQISGERTDRDPRWWHSQPSWHWPSYLSHTDIIRHSRPASHHDTQDRGKENYEAVAWRECDTNAQAVSTTMAGHIHPVAHVTPSPSI